MARYRKLLIKDGEDGWFLMNPANPWECLRTAWLLWKYPDRIAALVGVKEEFRIEFNDAPPND